MHRANVHRRLRVCGQFVVDDCRGRRPTGTHQRSIDGDVLNGQMADGARLGDDGIHLIEKVHAALPRLLQSLGHDGCGDV